MTSLRPYQEAGKQEIRRAMAYGKKNVLLQASCGAGKTIISADIVKSAIEKGSKVLFLVNRRDLVKQTVDKYTQYGLGEYLGVIMAGEQSALDRPVQIASLQT
ncbi:MAG: DEAD/DEAH box helicase family protein, partial [Desulfatitalea sp.]